MKSKWTNAPFITNLIEIACIKRTLQSLQIPQFSEYVG